MRRNHRGDEVRLRVSLTQRLLALQPRRNACNFALKTRFWRRPKQITALVEIKQLIQKAAASDCPKAGLCNGDGLAINMRGIEHFPGSAPTQARSLEPGSKICACVTSSCFQTDTLRPVHARATGDMRGIISASRFCILCGSPGKRHEGSACGNSLPGSFRLQRVHLGAEFG